MGRHVLLLSGGAFKGAVQLRSIRRVLSEVGMPDVIRGTSVGASNGAMVASGRVDELEAMWRDLDDPHPMDGVRGFLRATPLGKGGFWSLDPLGDETEKRRVQPSGLRCEFGVGVWLPEIDEHIVVSWTSAGPAGHAISMRDGICASAAIMGMFEPVQIGWRGGMYLAADGGHEHVLPPCPALVPGDSVDAVFCHPVEPGVIRTPQKKVDGRLERLMIAADKATHAPAVGDFIALQALAKLGVNVRVFAPRESPRGMLDASGETIAWRLDDLGARMAARPIWTSTDGATPRES